MSSRSAAEPVAVGSQLAALPNLLSLGRIALVPVVAALIYSSTPVARAVAGGFNLQVTERVARVSAGKIFGEVRHRVTVGIVAGASGLKWGEWASWQEAQRRATDGPSKLPVRLPCAPAFQSRSTWPWH